MKTSICALLALIAIIGDSEEAPSDIKQKRSNLDSSYILNENAISLGDPVDLGCTHTIIDSQSGWKGSNLPDIYASSIDRYLPISDINPIDYNLKVNFIPSQPPPRPSTIPLHIPIIPNIAAVKPVQEPQEFVPPQSVGSAVLPPMPPPATPVNAVASNIPTSTGAVFLGSGSLGVVNLGNGAYALGSGSLGYSGNRAQTRPAGNFPVYPPLQATPNLIPAAVPSPAPPQPNFAPIPNTNNIDFNHPLLNQHGYEFLPPNRIGFGSANPRVNRVRTTQQFATPTLQVPNRPNPQLANVQVSVNGFPSASGLHNF